MKIKKLIFSTIALWMIGCSAHGYINVVRGQNDPTFYGYERPPIILIAGCLVYWFPYWLAALVIAVALELLIPEIWPSRPPLQPARSRYQRSGPFDSFNLPILESTR